ncbi:MAG TPA: hypothetical protein VHO94_03050 [Oscillospiraceae bacterium]|nr:hypothetical protein [Oscillospiraceae bacterium]
MGTVEITISIIVALVGCFVGLAGWLSGRDKHISDDAEWRGCINAKLDVIVGIKEDMESIKLTLSEHGEKIASVDSSTQQAHHRIDEINRKLGGNKE